MLPHLLQKSESIDREIYMNNILFLCVCNSHLSYINSFPLVFKMEPTTFFSIYSNIISVNKTPVTDWMFVSSQNVCLEPKPKCNFIKLDIWEVDRGRVPMIKFSYLMKRIRDSKKSYHCSVMCTEKWTVYQPRRRSLLSHICWHGVLRIPIC